MRWTWRHRPATCFWRTVDLLGCSCRVIRAVLRPLVLALCGRSRGPTTTNSSSTKPSWKTRRATLCPNSTATSSTRAKVSIFLLACLFSRKALLCLDFWMCLLTPCGLPMVVFLFLFFFVSKRFHRDGGLVARFHRPERHGHQNGYSNLLGIGGHQHNCQIRSLPEGAVLKTRYPIYICHRRDADVCFFLSFLFSFFCSLSFSLSRRCWNFVVSSQMMKVEPSAATQEEHELQAVTKLRYMMFREQQSSSCNLGFRIEAIKVSSLVACETKQNKF